MPVDQEPIHVLRQIQSFLLWCTAINYSLLIAWVLIATLARLPWQRLQIRLFHVPAESIDTLNWAGIALYKLAIVMFNLVPCIALRLVLGAAVAWQVPCFARRFLGNTRPGSGLCDRPPLGWAQDRGNSSDLRPLSGAE